MSTGVIGVGVGSECEQLGCQVRQTDFTAGSVAGCVCRCVCVSALTLDCVLSAECERAQNAHHTPIHSTHTHTHTHQDENIFTNDNKRATTKHTTV